MQPFCDRHPPRSMRQGRFLITLGVWLASLAVLGVMVGLLLLAPFRDRVVVSEAHDSRADDSNAALTIPAGASPLHEVSAVRPDTPPPAPETAAPAEVSDAVAAPVSRNALLLWEVRGGTGLVYLFGSVHVGTPDFYPLDPAVLRAWDGSDRLAVEVDMMDTASPDLLAAQRLAASRSRIPGGGTLADHLPAETLASFRAFCERQGLGYEGYLTMQPWIASVTITLWMAGREGYTPFHGIDNFFLRNARARRRPIHSLETAVSQVELLSGQPMDVQMKGMAELIESLASGEANEDLRALLQAWRMGDETTLLALVEKDRRKSPDHEAFFEQLLYRRNRDMAAVIHDRFLDGEGTTFVVVGAAHLVGERSVQDYLLERVPTLVIERIAPATLDTPASSPDA